MISGLILLPIKAQIKIRKIVPFSGKKVKQYKRIENLKLRFLYLLLFAKIFINLLSLLELLNCTYNSNQKDIYLYFVY